MLVLGYWVQLQGPEREWKATWMAKHAKKAKMMAGGCGMQIHTLWRPLSVLLATCEQLTDT